MSKKTYIPIDCRFYDELVQLSMQRTPITLVPNKYNLPKGDHITDLITLPTKEEFMVMKSGVQIRLDEISTASDNILFLHASESFFEEE